MSQKDEEKVYWLAWGVNVFQIQHCAIICNDDYQIHSRSVVEREVFVPFDPLAKDGNTMKCMRSSNRIETGTA